ncbi:MAG: hypothetical protein ACOCXV_01265, partial [Bacteroidota bacterium]
MKNLKKLSLLLLLPSFLLLTTSCEKEDDLNNGNAALKFKGVYNPDMQTKSSALGELLIESFTINIEGVEFEFDDDNENNSGLTYSEIELQGPFEINLVEDGQGQVVSLLNDFNLPETGYDEIEFEFDKNENPESEMYTKSVL